MVINTHDRLLGVFPQKTIVKTYCISWSGVYQSPLLPIGPMFANAGNKTSYPTVSINTHRHPQHIIWPPRVDCAGCFHKTPLP